MASVQDIDSRLRTVEDMLEFVMTAMRMKAAVPTGLLNPDGTHAYQHQDGSMLDWYRLSRQLPVVHQSDAEPPSVQG